MKTMRVAITIFSLSLLTGVLKAQHISLGPIVGFQDTWVTGDLPAGSKYTFHPTFNAGGSFVYSTAQHFGFGADLKYSMEGYTIKTEGTEENEKFNSSYLRLPLRVIYFFGDYGQSIRPKIFLGPTLGLLLAAKEDEQDVKDETSGFDFGAHVGVGVNFRLAEALWLNTDVTYTQGFVDVLDNEEYPDNNLNGGLGVNVGLLFGFGGRE